MTLGASSICVVTRQTANPRDLTSANFWGKFTHFPCKLQFKRPVLAGSSAHLIALQRRNPTRGNVVFVISNENDEAGGGISHACTDKNSNLGMKLFLSRRSLYQASFSQSSFNVGNLGNLLDKLKAVLLHVLLMEQWNDSRIKLSHRYSYHLFVTVG